MDDGPHCFVDPAKNPFVEHIFQERKYNLSGLKEILLKVAENWSRENADLGGRKIIGALREKEYKSHHNGALGEETLQRGAEELMGQYDRVNGGFGEAPKFPIPSALTFLLRWRDRSGDEGALWAVCHSLEAMAGGGILIIWDTVSTGIASMKMCAPF